MPVAWKRPEIRVRDRHHVCCLDMMIARGFRQQTHRRSQGAGHMRRTQGLAAMAMCMLLSASFVSAEPQRGGGGGGGGGERRAQPREGVRPAPRPGGGGGVYRGGGGPYYGTRGSY